MTEKEKILRRDFSEEFVEKMKNAMLLSHHKYGYVSQTYPELAQGYKCIKERLELYEKTHNTEHLVDAANFCMIEFMFPTFADAQYIVTDSDKSPGLAGGISYNELMGSDWGD